MDDRTREAAKGRLPDLRGTRTHECLGRFFSNDARAAVLYAYFARIAEIEGFHEIAGTLHELSEGTELFAEGHLDFLKKTGHPVTGRVLRGTADNLAALRDAARVEATEDLLDAARTAHAEGFPDIASWFESVAVAKAAHADRCEAVAKELRD
ncbi:MAG TPA: rubrerythrin [Myxococcota bacterium]|nr:rubrerythrin [Myxococcota bacterium]